MINIQPIISLVNHDGRLIYSIIFADNTIKYAANRKRAEQVASIYQPVHTA